MSLVYVYVLAGIHNVWQNSTSEDWEEITKPHLHSFTRLYWVNERGGGGAYPDIVWWHHQFGFSKFVKKEGRVQDGFWCMSKNIFIDIVNKKDLILLICLIKKTCQIRNQFSCRMLVVLIPAFQCLLSVYTEYTSASCNYAWMVIYSTYNMRFCC